MLNKYTFQYNIKKKNTFLIQSNKCIFKIKYNFIFKLQVQ